VSTLVGCCLIILGVLGLLGLLIAASGHYSQRAREECATRDMRSLRVHASSLCVDKDGRLFYFGEINK
jgi:hypothetical protein